jgi:hypothetical protein
METIDSNAVFFARLRSLIDSWCDRRPLRPLASVLGPYLAFDGLTDSWGQILEALKTIRALWREDATEAEMDAVEKLIRAAEEALYRDRPRSQR